jgi:hypothetical protein
LATGLADDQYEAGVELTRTGVNVNASGLGWTGGHFTLTNHATKALTAARVTFQVSDTAGEVLEFMATTDGFLTQSPVAVGGSVDIDTGTTGSFRVAVAGVTASLSYVEFADGTRSGKGADKVFEKLSKEREQAVTYAQSLSSRLKQGAPLAEVMAAVSSSGAEVETPGVRTAKGLLRDAVAKSGLSALAEELNRISSIPKQLP